MKYCGKDWSDDCLKRRKSAAVCLLLCILCLLAGCGDKTEPVVTELGVDGYVYVAELLLSNDTGRDSIIKGVGDYLYYTQSTQWMTSVKRVPLPSEDKGILSFKEGETIFSVLVGYLQIPEEMSDMVENRDYAGLLASGNLKAAATSYGALMLDPEANYCVFSLVDYAVDQDNNFYCGINASLYKGFDTLEDTGGILCKLNAEGGWEYHVSLPSTQIKGLAIDSSGRLIVLLTEGLCQVRADGTVEKAVDPAPYRMMDNVRRESLYGDEEGNIYYIAYYGNGKQECMSVIPGDILKLSTISKMGIFSYYNVQGSGKGNLYFTNTIDDMLYQYDADTGSVQELLRWGDSNFLGEEVETVAWAGENRLAATVWSGSAKEVYLLTKTPVDEVPEKKLIVLAATYPTQQLRQIVNAFNKRSQKYHCIIERYGAGTDGTDAGVDARLDVTLTSSNPPDIMDLHNMDFFKYAQKGVLEDLSPYLDGSSQMDRSEMLESLLEGYTFEGKLLCIPTTFSLEGVVVRASQAEGLEGWCWTMEDVYELTERNPEMTKLYGDSSRVTDEYVLETFCRNYYLEKFVDWEKGECSFDSEEFRRLLKWEGMYWESDEKSSQTVGNGISGYSEYVAEDELFYKEFFSAFDMPARCEILFGEEIRMFGFPTVDGECALKCRVYDALAIVSNGSNKEGAWEFLEYYLSISKNSNVQLSVWREKNERKARSAATSNYLNEEPGMTFYVDNESFRYYGTPQEQIDTLMSMIEGANFTPASSLEDNIVNIVIEEAEGYFNGDKNLDDTIKVIQNRVTLLLQENR